MAAGTTSNQKRQGMDPENIVYLVDPDEDMSRSAAALLGSCDIRVKRFVDPESFLLAAQSQSVDNSCLLIELDLPDARGLSLLRQLREKYKQLPVIAMGEGVPADMAQQARDAGATEFIEKSLVGTYPFHRLAELIPGPPFAPLAAASAVTDRLQLATGIAIAATRSLLKTAMAAIDLDRISQGRFILGLGTSASSWTSGVYGTPRIKPVTS